MCVRNCAHGALSLVDRKATIDYTRCVGCGQCIAMCQYNAAVPGADDTTERLNYKIAEYTQAVLKDKPHFHVSFIVDVSPECDCWNHNDAPIVPNIGILASFDPVALDRACLDLVYASQDKGRDHLVERIESRNGVLTVDAAEALGIGSTDYTLINID